MRKLLRSVAHHKMKKAGIQHMNKRPWVATSSGPVSAQSYFAQHWREYVSK